MTRIQEALLLFMYVQKAAKMMITNLEQYAVPSQSLDVCEYLLANGADPNGSQ
jgi:hypothetical protein